MAASDEDWPVTLKLKGFKAKDFLKSKRSSTLSEIITSVGKFKNSKVVEDAEELVDRTVFTKQEDFADSKAKDDYISARKYLFRMIYVSLDQDTKHRLSATPGWKAIESNKNASVLVKLLNDLAKRRLSEDPCQFVDDLVRLLLVKQGPNETVETFARRVNEAYDSLEVSVKELVEGVSAWTTVFERVACAVLVHNLDQDRNQAFLSGFLNKCKESGGFPGSLDRGSLIDEIATLVPVKLRANASAKKARAAPESANFAADTKRVGSATGGAGKRRKKPKRNKRARIEDADGDSDDGGNNNNNTNRRGGNKSNDTAHEKGDSYCSVCAGTGMGLPTSHGKADCPIRKIKQDVTDKKNKKKWTNTNEKKGFAGFALHEKPWDLSDSDSDDDIFDPHCDVGRVTGNRSDK